ncbi:amylo-alpha-1,6-glucosidase [Microbacterium album]|uniref:Amylo-alpha-1,6-glucosidase n=1 Tax=Microbacterium album TaxID=2053191 RepID=A0A917MMS3_9MICO|nr:glycogen debranching N-terminal domain-containing protein [Microbacterium album]GGH48729.1 amylo-alpha-1,6-glucosidase [Microbacterium album]
MTDLTTRPASGEREPSPPSVSDRPESAGGSIEDDRTRPRGIAPVLQPQASVTLVEGSSFCVSRTNGDMLPTHGDGLFVQDTRVLSRWQLRIDGDEVEPLSALPAEPYESRFVGRIPARQGAIEPTVIVERHRLVGRGMREDITLTNYGAEAAGLDVVLHVDADFADLFEVKERRPVRALRVTSSYDAEGLHFGMGQDARTDPGGRADGSDARGVRVSAPGAQAVPGALLFRAVVPAGESWSASVEVLPAVAGSELAASFPLDRPLEATEPARRMRGWRDAAPTIAVGNTVLAGALSTSERDLGALRIVDPEHPDEDVVAAGAPWFMALFGRDSLLTSSMMMPFAPGLALGTLRTLARLQGTRDDPMTEEQPGRILHEVRLGADLSLALGGDRVYYGSIDSTPLFVMLVGQALRWGVPHEEIAELKPAVDRAIAWIESCGDRDGDGFVEYRRGTDRGLANQGWKDSSDSIAHRDGHDAEAPIALAEVQGYCYAAYLAAAELEDAIGDAGRAAMLRERAGTLRRRFHEAFWMPDDGFYALALDARKEPLRVLASNVGHCLWSGIVPEEFADRVIDRFLQPDLFTGFGIRTLSAQSRRFNPASYHNGSVWPHDTVLTAAGMARYGRRDAAMQVAAGLLDALEAFGGRLPELFCGFDRDDKPVPIPYPTSCSPQAWAAATPFEILRIGLGLEADAPAGVFRACAVPPALGRVELTGLPLAGRRVDIVADEKGVTVTGLPEELVARSC